MALFVFFSCIFIIFLMGMDLRGSILLKVGV